MMCGESCGEGSILAAGEIRPSEDTSILLPSQLPENKDHEKRLQNPQQPHSTDSL